MTQLTNPGSLREQAKRLEQAAKKLKDAAAILEGLEGEVPENGQKKGKLGILPDVLKQNGSLSVAEIHEKLKVSRGAIYVWLKKHSDIVDTENGRVILKA